MNAANNSCNRNEVISINANEIIVASIWRRIIARSIDVLFFSIIYYVLAYVTESETIMLEPTQISLPQNILELYSITFFIFCLLNIVLIINYGQTIGKRLLRIKVVTCDNTIPPVWKMIFIRELFFFSGVSLFMLIFIGFVEFAFVPNGRYIPDQLSNTYVVFTEK